ncbi:MAG: transcriptional repressor [Peptoniphilaceae bacterium]|nr:transcriptional repressor [Peptoniphilaceae bacterium]MDD7382945.1 transcriptional repressor [Peptoniphilaceae bacterium]MDY3737696.1 transcriptional repressor [Peptoniphilaceae bacterium]
MEKIEKILKDNHITVTQKRISILKILGKIDNPISAEELLEKAKIENFDLDLSTVYRNLNKFVEKDVVIQYSSINGTNYYQLKSKKHKHILTCVKCGKTIALDHCPVESLEKSLEMQTNFTILNHNLEFLGICPECKKGKA